MSQRLSTTEACTSCLLITIATSNYFLRTLTTMTELTLILIFRHGAADNDLNDAVSVIVYNVAGDTREEEDVANAQDNGTVGTVFSNC